MSDLGRKADIHEWHGLFDPWTPTRVSNSNEPIAPTACSGMAALSLPDDANPGEGADVAVAEKLVPHARNPLVRAIGAASDLSDQVPIYCPSLKTMPILSAARSVAGLLEAQP